MFFYFKGYCFFAILGPRFIHDITAFVIYSYHDQNKHQQNNYDIYYWFKLIKIQDFLVLPILAISITYLLKIYGDDLFSRISFKLFGITINNAINLGFIGYLSLLHYYFEAFTWKNPSPYKKYLAFSSNQ